MILRPWFGARPVFSKGMLKKEAADAMLLDLPPWFLSAPLNVIGRTNWRTARRSRATVGGVFTLRSCRLRAWLR